MLVFNKYEVLKNISLYIRVKKELACVYLVISDTTIYRTKCTLSQMNVNMNIKCGPCTQKHWISLCAHSHTKPFIYTWPRYTHTLLSCKKRMQHRLSLGGGQNVCGFGSECQCYVTVRCGPVLLTGSGLSKSSLCCGSLY